MIGSQLVRNRINTNFLQFELTRSRISNMMFRGNVDKMTPQVKMTPIEIFNVFELSAFLNREVT
jgi:hypothetical protein